MANQFVGKLLTEARSDISNQYTNYRVIYEGVATALTADYDPGRLNVYVDTEGKISSVNFG